MREGMVEKTTGVILRVLPLTESSLIVDWITADFGRISTAAKGATRSKSPFRGKLDLFFRAEISFTRNRRSDLHALREIEVSDTHAALRKDLALLEQAAYCAKLLVQTTETETPVLALFQLFEQFLHELVQSPARARTVFAFELKLLHELGLKPDWQNTTISQGAKETLEQLLIRDWPDLNTLKADRKQFEEIKNYLHGFLVYHLGKIPAGRAEAIQS